MEIATNDNLSRVELERLRGDRLNARTIRKFYARRRYERQYARRAKPERMLKVSDIVQVTVGPLIHAYGPIGSDNLT